MDRLGIDHFRGNQSEPKRAQEVDVGASQDRGAACCHGGSLGLEGRSKFKELLAAGAPRHPIGRFRPRRPGGSGTFSNFELWAPEVAF